MYSMKYIIAKILRKVLNPAAINHSELDKTARCDIGTCVSFSKMGRYSYIGEYSSLSAVEVGSFTSISSGCTIGGGSHPMDWVSMSPAFQNSGGIMRKKFVRLDYKTHVTTHIGSDVWIGGDCLIKGGVTIGDGAVVGMGSVVTHDVGPYEIWAGNPAKMIRKRFDEKTIERLLSVRWWDWDEKKIREYAQLMNNVPAFLRKVEEEK